MNQEQVEAMIRGYRANVGRCAHLDAEIRELEQLVRRALASMIENEVLPGIGLDGMPHSHDISRQVEEIAVRYADGYVPQEIREMLRRLDALKRDRGLYAGQLAYVEAWMKGLNDRQRLVLERQMIDGESWRKVAEIYRDTFGDSVSKDTLKRIREKAVASITAIADHI